MDDLDPPHAKLLYFVSELWKRQEITDSEKIIIKEMIISDESTILSLIGTYQLNCKEDLLKDSILKLVRKPHRQEELLREPPMQDEIGAPLWNPLFERKRRQQF